MRYERAYGEDQRDSHIAAKWAMLTQKIDLLMTHGHMKELDSDTLYIHDSAPLVPEIAAILKNKYLYILSTPEFYFKHLTN